MQVLNLCLARDFLGLTTGDSLIHGCKYSAGVLDVELLLYLQSFSIDSNYFNTIFFPKAFQLKSIQ